jgi:hypothetical protein
MDENRNPIYHLVTLDFSLGINDTPKTPSIILSEACIKKTI